MRPLPRGSESISPTAHYTGYVWARNGLGEPSLATHAGRAMYAAGQTVLGPAGRLGAPTLEHFLLARHRIIDRLLDDAIVAGRVTTVVEIAAGMSPRGLRVTREHPTTSYVEADLPAMARRKRTALRGIDHDASRLRVEPVDAFSPELEELLAGLPADGGVAVVTEGLLNYFPTHHVRQLWTRLASALQGRPPGLYLSDLHVVSEAGLVDRAFAQALGWAVRGRVHLHFDDPRAAQQALLAAGFARARLHAPADHADLPGMRAAGAGRVRVVEAEVS